MIINGYILQLQSTKQFLFYLIQSNIQLKDFHSFAQQQTSLLCSHIENFIKENNVEPQYLSSAKTNKDALAKDAFEKCSSKEGLVSAFST